jgi:hypothetical protein
VQQVCLVAQKDQDIFVYCNPAERRMILLSISLQREKKILSEGHSRIQDVTCFGREFSVDEGLKQI